MSYFVFVNGFKKYIHGCLVLLNTGSMFLFYFLSLVMEVFVAVGVLFLALVIVAVRIFSRCWFVLVVLDLDIVVVGDVFWVSAFVGVAAGTNPGPSLLFLLRT